MPPDEPNEEEALEELPEDHDTPFSPPDPGRDDPADQNLIRERDGPARAKDTYPTTDTDLDRTEIYQEGVQIVEPNAGNAVEGYDPDKDQRRKARQ